MSATVAPRVTHILVVDDHPIVRKGLVELFNDESDLRVSGEASTVATALAAVAATPPDVAVIDLTLGTESGLDLVTAITTSHPSVHVLVLSAHDERLYAERALKAGALGYVMKDHAATEILTALRRVAHGQSYVSAETTEQILSTLGSSKRMPADSRSPLERLSDREQHVLTLLGQGLGTRDIATRLAISVKTVESHYAHLKQKLGARNGRELARLAVSWTGAVSPTTAPRSR